MPDLTTHLFFSIKIFNKGFNGINKKDFLLGVIAPDCIRSEEFIKKYHFLNTEGKIEIDTLKNLYAQISNVETNCSFYLGYLTHLYLDYYFDENKDNIFLYNIDSNEDKVNLMKKIKNYNIKKNEAFFKEDIENATNLSYEHLEQAVNRLNELMFLKSDFDTIDNFEALNDYIDLIDRVVSDFQREEFLSLPLQVNI
jgi:hypothetical protein